MLANLNRKKNHAKKGGKQSHLRDLKIAAQTSLKNANPTWIVVGNQTFTVTSSSPSATTTLMGGGSSSLSIHRS